MNVVTLLACVFAIFLISFLVMFILIAADSDYEDDEYGND